MFGDPARDYAQALEQYYTQGPRTDWQGEFISAYASSHPLEDWAETWGHYLHIRDVLETADSHGVEVGQRHAGRSDQSWADMVARWQALSVVLNELNRSLGLTDVYPFVLNAPAVRKLEFVHKLVTSLP